MSTINGTTGPDNLVGTTDADLINGLAGNDTLSGGAGNDTLNGNEGTDAFFGGAGDDQLFGGQIRSLSWLPPSIGDWDYAHYYDVTGAGINLNLSTMKVAINSGAFAGTDTLVGIEEVRGSVQSDTITGGLYTLATSNAGLSSGVYKTNAQTGMSLVLMGGSDTVRQSAAPFQYWLEGVFVNYAWSGSAIQLTSNGGNTTVNYAQPSDGKTFWLALSQNAGTDTFELVNIFGDTKFNDTIDLSALTNNFQGTSRNFVNVTAGNDTVTGNGNTSMSVPAGTGLTPLTTGSTTGVNVTLKGTTTSTIDMTHLQYAVRFDTKVTMGVTTFSGVDDIRGTDFNDTLTGGVAEYNDFESYRGRGGNDQINGGTGYDQADYFGSTVGIKVDLAKGVATYNALTDGNVGTDTLRSVEAVRGSNLDDVFDARGFGQTGALNVGSNIFGGADGNSFAPMAGNDQVIGNGGTRIDYQLSGVGVDVNLGTGLAQARDTTTSDYLNVGFDSFSGVFRVRGSSLDDKLNGGGAGRTYGDLKYEAFEPGAGNDIVDGQGGWDEVYYGGGTTGVTIDMNLSQEQVSNDGYGGKDTLINIEMIGGSEYADSIKGRDDQSALFGNQEVFKGNKGNDTIDGRGGYDEISYIDDIAAVTVNLSTGTATDGWGTTDTLSNIEGIEASNWNDSITGNAGDNRLDGRKGNDTIDGGDGTDWVEYNNANEGTGVEAALGVGTNQPGYATGAMGADVLRNIENLQGSIYNDNLSGSFGNNVIEGLAGNDNISDGTGGNDTLRGGDGDDNLMPTNGNDSIDGGGGYDTVYYQDSQTGIVANLQTGVVSNDGLGGADTVVNVEGIHGASLANSGDYITLSNLGGYVFARAGNDTLIGGSGNDRFQSGSGNDSITGNAGIDTVIYRDDGFDTSNAPATTASVTVNLATGTATDQWGNTDRIFSVENIEGSSYSDSLTGDSNNNFIFGDDGADSIYGGDGVDTLKGGTGNDSILGGNGTDVAVYTGTFSEYTITTTNGVTTVTDNTSGRDGLDTLNGIETLSFTDGTRPIGNNTNTTITIAGTSNADTLTGTGANEQLIGLEGNDSLLGNGGADSLRGGAGNDTLDGGVAYDDANGSDYNWAQYWDAPAGISVDLALGQALNDGFGNIDTLLNISNISGSRYNDLIKGTPNLNKGLQFFYAGLGNDTIDGGYINPDFGGIGSKLVSYYDSPTSLQSLNVTSGITVDMNLTTGQVTGSYGTDTLININQVQGTDFADTFKGSDSDALETFRPGYGNDTIDARAGTNNNLGYFSLAGYINGNLVEGKVEKYYLSNNAWVLKNTDTILNNSIQGLRGTHYNDSMTGGNVANDGFERFEGRGGNDTIDGGTGYDRADYNSSMQGVVAQLGGSEDGWAKDGWGGTDVLRNVEGIQGSFYDDVLTGSDTTAFESFQGLTGNDTMDGRGGVDRADYGKALNAVVVVLNTNGTDGTAQDGYGTTDVLRNMEDVRGSEYADLITGNEAANKLQGTGGNDTLTGLAGDDTLIGGSGNDSVAAGDGVDTAVFSGRKEDYTITYDATTRKAIVVDKTDGRDGKDVLTNAEYLQFSNTLFYLLADTTAPLVLSVMPQNSSAEVAVDANVVVQFNELVKAGTGSLTVTRTGSVATTIAATDAQVTFVGSQMIINPTGDLTAGATYTVSVPSGFALDMAGNSSAAVGNYSFTTASTPEETPTPSTTLIDVTNLKLVNDSVKNTAKVTFDVLLKQTSFNGSKIAGAVIDLDYDASLVIGSYVSSAQYTRNGDPRDSWAYVTPNLDGSTASGKIALLADRNVNNTLTANADGKTATVTLLLKQEVQSFTLSFASGGSQVITENSLTATVGTGSSQTVTPTTVDTTYAIKTSATYWGQKAFNGVSVARTGSSETLTTSNDGTVSFSTTSSASTTLTATKALSTSEKTAANAAVGLGDAIGILKMIVGLNVNSNGSATSMGQLLAADYDQDGSIGLSDAIGVLKHVVGLAAPEVKVAFVKNSAIPTELSFESYNKSDAYGKASTNKPATSGWASNPITIDPTQTTSVELVGFLTGDVDGSWQPT